MIVVSQWVSDVGARFHLLLWSQRAPKRLMKAYLGIVSGGPEVRGPSLQTSSEQRRVETPGWATHVKTSLVEREALEYVHGPK